MNLEIRAAARDRQITRLCHLTPLRNLVHIASGDGLVSTQELGARERLDFNEQDLERLDAHPDYISCSIQYPNAWYLRSRRRDGGVEGRLFPDWVCLCIEPNHLWADETLFCPRNAAADGGRHIRAGLPAFNSLYATRTTGARDQVFTRNELPTPSPTDDQAEVLVRRWIPLDDVQQVVVADESQAKRTYLALHQLGVGDDVFKYVICPEFFDAQRLSRLLRSGNQPAEIAWDYRSLVRD